MLFIDGTIPTAARSETTNLFAARPGGIIVLHDIVENAEHPSNGVAQLWKELQPQSDYLEIIDN